MLLSPKSIWFAREQIKQRRAAIAARAIETLEADRQAQIDALAALRAEREAAEVALRDAAVALAIRITMSRRSA